MGVANAAPDGLGLAYVPDDVAQPHLAKDRLKRALGTGVPHTPATTSTIRADAGPHRRLPSWWMRAALSELSRLRGDDGGCTISHQMQSKRCVGPASPFPSLEIS